MAARAAAAFELELATCLVGGELDLWVEIRPATEVPVPAWEFDGLADVCAPFAHASVKGTMPIAMTTIMVAPAAHVRTRVVRRVGGVTGVGATHWRPSQKGMGSLRSAAWLTQKVPWLCGPASRRVCRFVGADDQGR